MDIQLESFGRLSYSATPRHAMAMVSRSFASNVLKQKGARFRDNYLDNFCKRYVDVSSTDYNPPECQAARVETKITRLNATLYVVTFMRCARFANLSNEWCYRASSNISIEKTNGDCGETVLTNRAVVLPRRRITKRNIHWM